MLSVRIGLLGVLALLPATGQVGALSPSQQATEKPAPHRFLPVRDKLEHSDGTAESSNWSGYAVTGSSFTSAQGSWVVPTTVCTSSSYGNNASYAAFWVGIDGYTSDSVEQTGTMSWCNGKTPSYYAWYEFYPNPMYEITSLAVSPGNKISASVTYGSSGFTVTLTNETTGKSYSKTSTVSGAARTSAEWIVEAPCCTNNGGILPLADFGVGELGSNWTGASYTNSAKDSSASGTISKFPAASVELINKISSSTSPQTSTCTTLMSDGNSFTCAWAQ